MATLNIRNLPDEVHKRLRVRAAKAGHSMEAEARAILGAACAEERETPTTAKDLRDLIDRLYGGRKPTGVVDDLIAERRREAAREASEA
jgi:plasmid stability protein